MVRCYGAVAPQKVADVIGQKSVGSSRTPSHRTASETSPRRSFHLGRSDTLPSYYTRPKSQHSEMRRANTSSRLFGLNISHPMSTNPEQFAKFKGSDEIQRPDLAAHPAIGGRF
jgi:hypothetical protein